MNTNNVKFVELMTEYELSYKNVVELMSSQYGTISEVTIDTWRSGRRNMPGPMLELFILKIQGVLDAQQDTQN